MTASELKVMITANENRLSQLDSKTSNDVASFFKSAMKDKWDDQNKSKYGTGMSQVSAINSWSNAQKRRYVVKNTK